MCPIFQRSVTEDKLTKKKGSQKRKEEPKTKIAVNTLVVVLYSQNQKVCIFSPSDL